MTWGPDKAASSAAAPAAPLDGMEGLEQPLIALRFGQTTHLQEVGAGFASDVVPVHAATWSCSVLQAGLCVLGFFRSFMWVAWRPCRFLCSALEGEGILWVIVDHPMRHAVAAHTPKRHTAALDVHPPVHRRMLPRLSEC